jgi:hypothetical protein
VTDQPRPIGEHRFTDGSTRSVFELPDGRQYLGDQGERVEGMWLTLADEPVLRSAPENEDP